jgi:MFS family permease
MTVLPAGAVSSRRTQLLIMLAPIALAFADASIVVLALPQIVARLHTSIDSVVLVIVVYNAGLIVGAVAVRFLAPESRGRWLLLGGLLLFGLTSLGSGLAPSLHWLLLFRAGQGLGGGVLLCASLPQLAAACGPDESPLTVWAAAAAVGAGGGPAPGGGPDRCCVVVVAARRRGGRVGSGESAGADGRGAVSERQLVARADGAFRHRTAAGRAPAA